jgi:hypothetical protein
MSVKAQIVCLCCLLSSLVSHSQTAQDSIILLNGRVFIGPVVSVSDGFLKYTETTKSGETFTSEFDIYRIFSYTQNGTETILYKQDDLKDNFLTVDEARNATLGSYDARKTFKPRFVFWSSMALGYGASIFDTYLLQKTVDHPQYVGTQTSGGLFKSRPTFMPIFAPLVLSVGWSLPSFKIKEKQMIQTHLLNDKSYYRGYHRIARHKRVFGALKGSLIGIAAGMITYAAFKP